MISTDYIQPTQVEQLSAETATAHLQSLRIDDVNLCQRLITYAKGKSGQVHPLYLGLGVDGVLQARDKGIPLTAKDFPTGPDTIDKTQVLIEQLLKYVNPNIRQAIQALIACRRFDFDLYCRLGEALNFSVSQTDFDLIIQFSFVGRLEQWGRDWYRVQPPLQQLDYIQNKEPVRQAHTVLEEYYWRQGKLAEAIYHANQLDWERGVKEWIGQFISAFQADLNEICRELVEIRQELSIKSHFQLGVISQFAGDYFAKIGQYEVAEQIYLDTIESYKQAMDDEPSYMDACENMGGMFIKLGQLQTTLSRYDEALHSYRRSISTNDRILSLNLNRSSAYNNKGLALQNLSQLQANLSRYEEAIEGYQAAIFTYKEALKRLPGDYYFLNDQAIALQGLGELRVHLSQPEAAIESFQQAIDACNQALNTKFDFFPAYVNKGIAFSSLGELQTILSQQQLALHSHEQAISSLEQALSLTPNDIHILNQLGATLHRLGLLRENLGIYSEAEAAYQYAIDVFAKILDYSPKSSQVYNNKGRALHKLGFLQAKLSHQSQARQSWRTALADFSRSLEISPNNQDIQNLKTLLQTFLES